MYCSRATNRVRGNGTRIIRERHGGATLLRLVNNQGGIDLARAPAANSPRGPVDIDGPPGAGRLPPKALQPGRVRPRIFASVNDSRR
jgi:hypothetical protein